MSSMADTNGVGSTVHAELRERLSRDASITLADGHADLARPRWSSFNAPSPKYIVNVSTEDDVARTVEHCVAHGIKFFAQNGGAGWANTFNLGENGVVINLAQLNHLDVFADKTKATIGGGALVKQSIEAASAAGVMVLTGNCECVGTLGAMLGGGYGYLSGLYGMAVDNVLEMRVVLPDGHLHNVTQKSDPDLFWALRGAGPNFGIVTSAVVRAYPMEKEEATAWTGPVIFSSDQLEYVVQVIDDLVLEPEMNIFMYFASSGPPSHAPVVMNQPFLFGGNAESGHEKFAKLFDIGPLMDGTTIIPYSKFAANSAPFCIPGARKPAYGAGFDRLIPSTWRQVWNLYVDFQKKEGAEQSAVLLERYPTDKIRSFSDQSASFPHRNVPYNAIVTGWYDDPALDSAAKEFGAKVRDAWRKTGGLAQHATYVNFGHGDEDLEVIYGESLPRLRELKSKIDPGNVFDQWFNIK